MDGSRVDRCRCCYPSSHSLQTLQFQWKKMILAYCKRLCHTSKIRQSQVILNLALRLFINDVVHFLGRITDLRMSHDFRDPREKPLRHVLAISMQWRTFHLHESTCNCRLFSLPSQPVLHYIKALWRLRGHCESWKRNVGYAVSAWPGCLDAENTIRLAIDSKLDPFNVQVSRIIHTHRPVTQKQLSKGNHCRSS